VDYFVLKHFCTGCVKFFLARDAIWFHCGLFLF
jgi:hypothetical protein